MANEKSPSQPIHTVPGATVVNGSILSAESTRNRLESIAQQVRVIESEIILSFRERGVKVNRCYLQTSLQASGSASISVANDENKEGMEKWLKETHRFTTTPLSSDGKNTRYIVSF